MKRLTFARELPAMLGDAQRTLGLSQAALGQLLGVSARTGHRWSGGRSHPTDAHLEQLAGHVLPKDAALAAKLADAAGTTLQALGLVPPPPPGPPPLTPDRVVDCVVCAAAEAMDVPPSAIRAPLLAAFARARELGISVEVMEAALAAAARPAKAEAKKASKPGGSA